VLDDRSRELITVTVLACLPALPQLKSHTAAALHVGVRPIQIREAIYQVGNYKTAVVAALVHCFPYIGFPSPSPPSAQSRICSQARAGSRAPR
jgi:alkylhydroperoxidase/carboxymuconolactone decarboxylase family protein YurZ